MSVETESLLLEERQTEGGLYRRFKAVPGAVGGARSMVREVLGPHVSEDRLEDAVTIIDELAVNAVEHGTPHDTPQAFAVGVGRLRSGGIFMLVANNSEEEPVRFTGNPEDLFGLEDGRGMLMVQALANTWGASHTISKDVHNILPSAGTVVYATQTQPRPEVQEGIELEITDRAKGIGVRRVPLQRAPKG